MPTVFFYVPKADVDDFNKAKDLLGEDYSPFIVRSLKSVAIDSEKDSEGFVEIPLFVGTEQKGYDMQHGKNIKFVGKPLSSRVTFAGEDIPRWYELYLTRKGKFLLYVIFEDEDTSEVTYSYVVYDTIKELRDKNNLPAELFKNAEKNMPNVTCEELDI